MTEQPSEPAQVISLREYAIELKLPLATARSRAYRALTGRYPLPGGWKVSRAHAGARPSILMHRPANVGGS